jgi:hypothetical protein
MRFMEIPLRIPQDSVDLHRERLPAWSRADKLKAAWLAELFGFPGDRAVVDEPITLALGTCMHRRPPPQTLASLSGGGVSQGVRHRHHYLGETLELGSGRAGLVVDGLHALACEGDRLGGFLSLAFEAPDDVD